MTLGRTPSVARLERLFASSENFEREQGTSCSARLYVTSTSKDYFSRKLLDARRTRDEFADAKTAYEEIRKKLRSILETWDQEEENLINTSRRQLENAYTFVSRRAEGLTRSALQATLNSFEEAFQGPGLTTIEQAMKCAESDSQPDEDFTKKVSSNYIIIHSRGLTVSHQGPQGEIHRSC
jgi:hypothetical protein